jgi:TRAP-type C4-dicarboxylate transport system substrate-binding protein
MLRGIYKYITRVYGNDRIPKELRELFEQAMNKWKDYNQRENEGAQKERKEFFEKDRKEFIQTMLGKTEIDDDLPF